jgi:hypothetical protein
VTGERIEWDAGDVNQFDVDWFINYLQWLLKQADDHEDIRTVRSLFQDVEVTDERTREQHIQWREQIFPILEQLYEKGLLTRSRTHYTVINKAP